MGTHSIKEIATSNDRFKLYSLICYPKDLSGCIDFLKTEEISVLNIGKELAVYIDSLEDYSYLNIDVYDYVKKLLDKHKTKMNGNGNDVLAIYNLGILFEPFLELNPTQILREFSKSTAVIIVWEGQTENQDIFHWENKKDKYFLDFSETQIKRLDYAI